MYRLLYFLPLILLFQACSPKVIEVIDFEQRDLDTLFVEAQMPDELKSAEDFKLPRYNESYKRQHDLLHTSLELSFNWEKEQVLGKATLDLKPLFYPQSELRLDAKNFEIHKIENEKGEVLKYSYDGNNLMIELGRVYQANEKFSISIDYTASPKASGGSNAITSNQGLFFVNPRGDEGDKPQQIWTQGETEWNSRWFPTIDKPNERCTQELKLKVAKRFKTLSNGVLKNSKDNGDGTRTDHWVMEQAHAPYLFMIAIGEFAVVSDTWNGIPVDYYVEAEYEASARQIFNHTPEMLQFFSDKLQYPYPWPKYAQVVVRDYVSGAMENTSAVIFGDFVQKHRRELIDNHNDGIVAHELFHHWFGDLVTCESWANLTMNEGFANYSEYLWFEHKYGKDEADYHMLSERSSYFYSARRNAHPLIYFGFKDKEDMFDAHSYNKGGAVLHMLRNYVGDQAFWTALNRYLKANEYQAVEAHNLRLAFEAVTGEDLNWFFDQWYFDEGHPSLEINYSYDKATQEAVIEVEQVQNPQSMRPIFQFPAAIDIYAGGQKMRKEIWLKKRKESFRIPVQQKPDLMTFDADYVTLKEVEDNKSQDNYFFQFMNASHFMDRYEALQNISDNYPQIALVYQKALKDPHWVIRSVALDKMPLDLTPKQIEQVRSLAESDPSSKIRSTALTYLEHVNLPEVIDIAKNRIEQDSAYNVIGSAIQVIYKIDKELAAEIVASQEDTDSEAIRLAIAQIYAESEDLSKLDFFQKNINKVDRYAASNFYGQYQSLALKADLDEAVKAMEVLRAIGVDQQQSPWRRFAATKSIVDMANEWQSKANREGNNTQKKKLNEKVDILASFVKEIKSKEQSQQLQSSYRQIVIIERI